MPVILRNEDDAIFMQVVDGSNNIDHLPAQVYKLGVTPKEVVLIKDRKRFDIPSKLFGEVNNYKDQILATFESTKDDSLGVLLTGLKGSGKSTTAEVLSNAFIARDYPVFMIDSPVPADLIRMVAKLGPCMIYFDEFGKVYNHNTPPTDDRRVPSPDNTEGLLTLFSDTSLKQVMFVVTANTPGEFSDYMLNRPGRFYYRINFGTVSDEVVTEVMKEYHVPDTLTNFFRNYVCKTQVSLDILRVIAKEAIKAHDTASFIKQLSLMNIPAIPTPTLILTKVTQKGNDVTEIADCRVKNIKHFTLTVGEEEMLYKREFDIMQFIDIHNLVPNDKYTLDLLDGVKIQFRMTLTGDNGYYSGLNYTALESKAQQEQNRLAEEKRRKDHEEWVNKHRLPSPPAFVSPVVGSLMSQ